MSGSVEAGQPGSPVRLKLSLKYLQKSEAHLISDVARLESLAGLHACVRVGRFMTLLQLLK